MRDKEKDSVNVVEKQFVINLPKRNIERRCGTCLHHSEDHCIYPMPEWMNNLFMRCNAMTPYDGSQCNSWEKKQ